MALPTLTPEQRADALAKAQAARKKRSELLASIKRVVSSKNFWQPCGVLSCGSRRSRFSLAPRTCSAC